MLRADCRGDALHNIVEPLEPDQTALGTAAQLLEQPLKQGRGFFPAWGWSESQGQVVAPVPALTLGAPGAPGFDREKNRSQPFRVMVGPPAQGCIRAKNIDFVDLEVLQA